MPVKLYDAHCHLANLVSVCDIARLMTFASEAGVDGMISSALTRSEAAWHIANPIPGVIWGVGIHPHYPACDITLNDLSGLLRQNRPTFIGEIGLDRYNRDLTGQADMFETQLRLADEYSLPVVLHLIGHTDTAVRLLKGHRLTYLVHGFAGSLESYRQLYKLGAWVTLSPRLLKADKRSLLREIVADGRYLFETDMTSFYWQNRALNPFAGLPALLRAVAEVCDIAHEQLLTTQWTNLCHIFPSEVL